MHTDTHTRVHAHTCTCALTHTNTSIHFSSEHRDVRHAGYYFDENSVTGLIADEFHRLYGSGAIPVPTSSTAETLHHLSSEVQEKVRV